MISLFGAPPAPALSPFGDYFARGTGRSATRKGTRLRVSSCDRARVSVVRVSTDLAVREFVLSNWHGICSNDPVIRRRGSEVRRAPSSACSPALQLSDPPALAAPFLRRADARGGSTHQPKKYQGGPLLRMPEAV